MIINLEIVLGCMRWRRRWNISRFMEYKTVMPMNKFTANWNLDLLTGQRLNWNPVDCSLSICLLSFVFTYKALKALAPRYISDFLVQYKAPRALRSSDKKLLQVPHFKLKTYGGRSFSYIAPYLWNQLPDAIRQAPSLATFKFNLKTYLFHQILISC